MHLAHARELIKDRVGNIVIASSIYESEPWGKSDQPWFYNQVIGVESTLRPRPLLEVLMTIEAEMGRERLEENGPRTIDLDILIYGREIVSDSDLEIPHPRIPVRNFVLIPLMEIASDLCLPGTKLTVEELYIDNREDLDVCLLEEDQ
ncbi:MAG: 2-amino-4-hydroxy-6-hydroxymethyldihydropteridine diphosphokinase [Saprospiraceae bacterium]|nr:2-amino-4-hydroxy-6-hydroxymethyldihydropteridine diphosphokinase [Saprospiraceae bacterium]